MTDILFPPHLNHAHTRVRYLDSTGMTRNEFTGVINTTGFAGDRLGASIEFTAEGGTTRTSERAQLIAWLVSQRGKQNRVYLTDHSHRRRGSFPTAELLSNPTFDGTTGWTVSGELTLTAQDRILRALRTAVTGDQTIRAGVATTVNGATYAARVFALAGRGAMDYRLRLGTSAGGAELAADGADYTSGGLRTLVATATGTSTHFSILDGNSSRSAGHYQEFAYASLARCALVAGASQTGSALVVDQLPVSTDGLLLMGDQFEVITSRGSELKIVTASLNSDSGGAGYLQFEPPLRGTVADNAAVIIHSPMGRFVYVGEVPEWANEPGLILRASQADYEEAA